MRSARLMLRLTPNPQLGSRGEGLEFIQTTVPETWTLNLSS